jgi:hypothetical protein
MSQWNGNIPMGFGHPTRIPLFLTDDWIKAQTKPLKMLGLFNMIFPSRLKAM